MESIKPLPERVRSSVRSGFIISDMIRVVEELVYNSLDAGATKVLVSVGVGTGYVKVEDNGCGISRDGLALLGERYATSKHQTLLDAGSVLRSFGNRGEVLCSIADVSLLEITAKAKGRPNGYRKIIKGSKCLHLGIDDDRRDNGTTVIVHDMFYNQPVRRTHMQTSPKKVLHSVKKCVLQIALVRPQVSFSIVDIESEDELLRTHASSSPLAILISHFGIKVTLLHELSLLEGPFELAGYISCSPDSFSAKGIQYIYVNSRFIDKSPIHKLLNGLASNCWEQSNNQGGKRSRPQACATYCLNLTCPQSSYDIHFEQLKTSVEFKDWLPVLSLIEKSVASLWTSRASNGKLFSSTADLTSKHHLEKEADIITSTNTDADFSDPYEIPKKRHRIQNNQSSQTALNSMLFPMEANAQEISQSSHYQGSKGAVSPSIGELKDDFDWMCPSRPYNRSDPGCSFPVMDCTSNHPWDVTDKLTTVSEDQNLSSIRRDGSSAQDCFSSEKMVESPIRITFDYKRNKEELSPENQNPFQFEDDNKPFWRNCCSPESANSTYFKNRTSLENLHDVSFNGKERSEFHIYHHETDGEYIGHHGDELADIDSELIPSREDFTEDLFTTRKYSSFLEDRVSSQEMDECPRMSVASPRSNEEDPSLRNYLPSRFQDVNGLFLRNCSSLKNTNEFIDEKWSEFQSDDGVQRADSMKFHGVNENLDGFQRTMWQDNDSVPFPFNESKAGSARSKISLFCDQAYAAAGHDEYRSVQEFGGFDASFESSDTECKDVISDSIFGVNSWDFEHRILHEQGGNARSRSHANFDYFKHEKKDFDSCDIDDGFTYEEYLSKVYSNSPLRNICERGSRDTNDFEHQILQGGGVAGSRNHANFKYFKDERKNFDSCDFVDGFTYEDDLSKGKSNSHLRNGCERGNRDTDDFEHQSLQERGGNARSRNLANFKYFKDEKMDFDSHDFDDGFTYEDYMSKGCSNSHLRGGCERPERSNRDTNDSYLFGHHLSGKPSASAYPQTHEGFTLSSPVYKNPPIHVESVPKIHQPRSDIKHRDVHKARKKRSHSAPPIYSGKRRFFPMNARFNPVQAYPDKRIPTGSFEIEKEKFIHQSSSQCDQFPDTSSIGGLPLHTGRKMKKAANVPDVAKTQNGKKKKLGSPSHASSQCDQFPDTNPIGGLPLHTGRKMKETANVPDVEKTQNGKKKKLGSPSHACDTTDLGAKWRNGCPQAGCDYLHNSQMIRGKSLKSQDKYTILDVSSGILHLASDTIVPKSINRNCLEASRVLMQVDKKFIPVVAGKTLAVIDQHAADERIRLEDLRHKVLSGKMKTVAHLEEEKEMMLPESACQLLHNYADQIRHWGWICNFSQESQSFTKNLNLLNRQPGAIRLVAVPCILGVNLSDDDLLEFIEQLSDTDGSSTVPPSVLRVLNNKACRGAIMFGDALLPSECSLIVEELKRTSLCFQCAHGRPTMAPLINLEDLHKQIGKLGLCNKDSSNPWHGLRKQPISLERSKQRLGTNECRA